MEQKKNPPTLFARHEMAVVDALRRFGPSICERLEYLTGMPHQTVSPTLTHLQRRGCVVDSGKKELTQSRRPAIVWKLAKNHEAMQLEFVKRNLKRGGGK